MKKICFLFIVIIGFPICSRAQYFDWIETYTGSDVSEGSSFNCIDAEKLYSLLQELEFMQKSCDSTNRTEALINDNQPYLVPNPAHSRVSIAGYESSIVDIAVMDMNGRHVAAFGNTDSFDATGLRAGMYIVRVNYRNVNGKSQVVYLKLIKE